MILISWKQDGDWQATEPFWQSIPKVRMLLIIFLRKWPELQTQKCFNGSLRCVNNNDVGSKHPGANYYSIFLTSCRIRTLAFCSSFNISLAGCFSNTALLHNKILFSGYLLIRSCNHSTGNETERVDFSIAQAVTRSLGDGYGVFICRIRFKDDFA